MTEYTPKQRTAQQNRALHVFFEMLAGVLNSAGLDQKEIITVDIAWTPEAVKDYLWRPVQRRMFQKESTTELAKMKEIDAIHEQLMQILGQHYGVDYIPFPHFEDGHVDDEGRLVIKG